VSQIHLAFRLLISALQPNTVSFQIVTSNSQLLVLLFS